MKTITEEIIRIEFFKNGESNHTREEYNHRLRVIGISSFSSLVYDIYFPFFKLNASENICKL